MHRTTTPPRSPVASGRVLAAELTKLTTLRWPWWVLVATVLVAAALAVATGMYARASDARPAASLVVSGYVLAQLGPLVLGVLVGTEEYTTGTFRATFTAVPRRLPVLAAQTSVTAAAGLLVAAAALGGSLLATLGQHGAGPAGGLAGPEAARQLAGFVLYLTGIALLGLGAGALVRRPAGAFVAGVTLLVVLDQVLAANPGRVTDTVRALLPGTGSRMLLDDARLASLDATGLGPDLGTWGGGLVLAAWVVVLLAAAGYRLRHHDLR
ncbi:hypothetical protein [Cellulosimicrobium cellulans]|uniref:hypothetical protein n=1 Tax=Cellulosimicrobium cellulans TaxID=1710 RepID=UPI00084919BF|nr:hypothetical protein [Cellulosimicrobium cellulans]